MNKPLFFTPTDGRYGFDLAGFQQVVTDRQGLDTMLEQMINKEETPLLIIDERLLDKKIETKLIRMREQLNCPSVILPPPHEIEDDYGQQLLSQVLGYKIKLSV